MRTRSLNESRNRLDFVDSDTARAATASLQHAVDGGIPGVVAGAAFADGGGWIGSAGERTLGAGSPMTTDTVFALHSATKAVTATAALQCVEDGLIDLDTPAREYLPEIGELQVLDELGDDGSVRTRPPRREITPRMLLLHTSGLAYDLFDPRYARLARQRMLHPSPTPMRDMLHTPLLHDPGEQWTYGTSLDWLGLIVAAARARRLDDVCRERIFEPCSMSSTSFDVTAAMRPRLAGMHRRGRNGTVAPVAVAPPDRPELDMGGQGLYSTVPDYLAFLRVWLGDGSAPGGRVLRPDTVAWAVRGAPGVAPTPLPTAIPSLTRTADFYPGLRTSWAYSFLVNEEDVPAGPRAGTLAWAGMANLFFWVDRASGMAAVWAAQLLPFFDPAATGGLAAFRRALYRAE